MSNLTITANASLPQESETDTFQTRQSSAISEHSSVKGSPQAIRAWLTSLPPASRASLSAPPESEPEPTTPAICGQQPSNASAWYDRASHSWRTFQVSFLAVTLEPFSETWPRAGMMHAGAFYPQPSWEHRISEIGCGYWLTPSTMQIGTSENRRENQNLKFWPTPRASDATGGTAYRKPPSRMGGFALKEIINRPEMWPTPAQRDWRSGKGRLENGHTPQLPEVIGGQLNPTWVEWLMGWPLGWTDLKPLAMDKFRQWFEQHGGSYLEVNNEQRTR